MMGDWPHDSTRSVDVLSGCFWVARREALDEVGLLDEDFFIYCEDYDWCKRFSEGGWDVVFYPGAEVIHFGGRSTGNTPLRFFLEQERSSIRYWRKHHSRTACTVHWLLSVLFHAFRILGRGLVGIAVPPKRARSLEQIRKHRAALRYLLRSRAGTIVPDMIES
jgi:GT2 family glycosyltransferase